MESERSLGEQACSTPSGKMTPMIVTPDCRADPFDVSPPHSTAPSTEESRHTAVTLPNLSSRRIRSEGHVQGASSGPSLMQHHCPIGLSATALPRTPGHARPGCRDGPVPIGASYPGRGGRELHQRADGQGLRTLVCEKLPTQDWRDASCLSWTGGTPLSRQWRIFCMEALKPRWRS